MEAADRIAFGKEVRASGAGVVQYVPVRNESCPDCGTRRGQPHERGCHLEQCPRCGEPLRHCGHGREVLG